MRLLLFFVMMILNTGTKFLIALIFRLGFYQITIFFVVIFNNLTSFNKAMKNMIIWFSI